MSKAQSKEVSTEVAAPVKDTSKTLMLKGPRLPYHPLIEERFGIDKSAWKALVEAIFPNATTVESVLLALSYCRARKLDPFKRNVHIVPIWSKDMQAMVDTIWPGIGELRTTAFRTGEYAGRAATEYGPDVTQKVGVLEITFPQWAQTTVWRMIKGQRVEFVGPRVYWLETYATRSRNDKSPNEMWANRPRGQIDKCFDADTEVLTDQGFQRFGFVTGRIMQVTDCGIEATDSVAFEQPYDGQMIVCDGNALNFCVTPNHDMATTAGKVEAQNVFDESTSVKGYEIPLTLNQSQSREDAEYSDEQLVLAGAIVCDGYKRKNGFDIAVSRPRKVMSIESMGMHVKRSIRQCAGDKAIAGSRIITTKADKAVFSFSRDVCSDLLLDSGDLNAPAILNLSRRQARVLADAMLSFDGSQSKTARRFFSSSLAVMSAFEVTCVIAGYSVSRRRERTSDIGGRNWCVTVSTKEVCKTMRASKCQSRLKFGMRLVTNMDGSVWCCRVPSGYIVVRRNGLSMICGNCSEAAALRAAFPEEVGGDFIPEEVQHDISGQMEGHVTERLSGNKVKAKSIEDLTSSNQRFESEEYERETVEVTKQQTTETEPETKQVATDGKLFSEGAL